MVDESGVDETGSYLRDCRCVTFYIVGARFILSSGLGNIKNFVSRHRQNFKISFLILTFNEVVHVYQSWKVNDFQSMFGL